MTYYIKGGSRYNESNPMVWMLLNLAGYSDALYTEGGWKEIDWDFNGSGEVVDEGDPFYRFGGSGGEQRVEIGLWNDYRLDISSSGIFGYHEGSGEWFDMFSSGGGTEPHPFDSASGIHTGALPLTDLGSYARGSIIIGGASDWEALSKGTETYVLKSGVTDIDWGQVSYSELSGVPTTLVKTDQANTYTAGLKQKMQANATYAGLSMGGYAGNPGTLVAGDLWYNTSSNRMMYRGSSASREVVARTLAQILTNKTVNATDNTITDTSTALGDILKSNATKFVRLARGSENHYLRATATDIAYGELNIAHDLSPQLGGHLDLNGKIIIGPSVSDYYIWAISSSYLTYGLYYNTGTPDYLEIKWAGSVSTRFNMEQGDMYLYDATFADYVRMYHSGTHGYVTTGGTGGGDLYLEPAGNVRSSKKIYNAVYNDYADYWKRAPFTKKIPGMCYSLIKGKGLALTSKRADKACMGICSDTYGHAVGNTKNAIPLSVGGFILANCDKEYEPGDLLVSNEDGILTLATKEEILMQRVVAKYMYKETKTMTKGVKVNGRHWVKIL